MKSISLIANSGIQFFSTTAIFQPDEPVCVGKDERPLPQMLFVEYPSLEDLSRNEIQIAYAYTDKSNNQKHAFLLSDLREMDCLKKVMSLSGNQDDDLDEAGVPRVDISRINPGLLSDAGITNCYSENTIEGRFRPKGNTVDEPVPPFELLLGKWIPVPMFYQNGDGTSRVSYPSAWCRVKITFLEKLRQGNKYRFDWAFDTTLANAENVDDGVDPEEQELPFFKSGIHKHTFCLPTRVGHLLQFLSENQWVGDYLQTLIFGEDCVSDIPLPNGFVTRCRHLAHYIAMFTNFRYLDVCPQVTLYNCDKEAIPVDLILDVGNSRTCGLLVEDENFSNAQLLALRDLTDTDTSKVKGESFDMRLAFHRTEFGQNNMGTSGVFEWGSFLRIGEEAKRLIAQSRKTDGAGESDRMTHHSSPKRYLWDDQKFRGQWQFLLTDEEPLSEQRDGVYVSRMTEQFKSDGTFIIPGDPVDDDKTSYSRRSLMTMVMIEILQQARCQINSPEYLKLPGNIDRMRVIRRIIVTCPTAMPVKEQVALRNCAQDAMIAIMRSRSMDDIYRDYNPEEWDAKVDLIPKPKDVEASQSPLTSQNRREWNYDEASCCQYVYLYSEIIDKYSGNCQKFIEGKGHVRADLKAEGYEKKSITIGSIDIGAGTTDLMICAYKYDYSAGSSVLTPIPLFWDSFYVAGDDILNLIIQNLLLRDKNQTEYRENYGPLNCALIARYLKECQENGDSRPEDVIRREAQMKADSEIVAFFSQDNNNMENFERIMRTDFNVMVSLPIAQKMLDMMKNGENAQDISYDQIFTTVQPSQQLLDFFIARFGLDLKLMKWTYSPRKVTECIVTKMDKLLKQLSVILHAYNCDVVLLAGRPMSLEPLTDLFLRYFPVSPDRLIRLLPRNEDACTEKLQYNCYKVGQWFPSHDNLGYFRDLKPVVATGAYVGYLASHGRIQGLQFDMKEMKKRMVSTANYMGSLDLSKDTISKEELKLNPDDKKSTARFEAHGLPHYIVCKQINTEHYEARPIYALTLKPEVNREQAELDYNLQTIRFTVSRQFNINKEELTLEQATDANGNDMMDLLQLKVQSLVITNGQERYWLDSGAFKIEV